MNTLFVTPFSALATAAQANSLVALAGLAAVAGTQLATDITTAAQAAQVGKVAGMSDAELTSIVNISDSMTTDNWARLLTLAAITAGQATQLAALTEAMLTAINALSSEHTVENLDNEMFSFTPSVGNYTAATTGHFLFVPNFAGNIVDVVLGARVVGQDATDPLFLEAIVKIEGTAVTTTNPKLDRAHAAGTAASNDGEGGSTAAGIDAANDDFAAGDIITLDFSLTRTTPDTEFADVGVTVYYQRTA